MTRQDQSVRNSRDCETYRLEIISHTWKKETCAESVGKYNGAEQGSFHLLETGIVPGKRSPRLFSCPHRPLTRAKAKQEDEILQSWSRTSMSLYAVTWNLSSVLVLFTATLFSFQSISHPRNSFLMTFRTSGRITKGYGTFKILLAHMERSIDWATQNMRSLINNPQKLTYTRCTRLLFDKVRHRKRINSARIINY